MFVMMNDGGLCKDQRLPAGQFSRANVSLGCAVTLSKGAEYRDSKVTTAIILHLSITNTACRSCRLFMN